MPQCCPIDNKNMYIYVGFVYAEEHPEVKTLFGPDPWLAVWSVLLVVFQVCSLWGVYHLSWLHTIILAYCLGGTLNHSLMLGQLYIYTSMDYILCM